MQFAEKTNPVVSLQTALRKISEYYDEIPCINVDGNFDQQTKNAVSAFQRLFDICPSGIVNYATHCAIFNEYKKIMQMQTPPPPLHFFPMENTDFENGCSDTVFILQIILQKMSRQFSNYPPVSVNGELDNATQSAIRCFQRHAMLPCTGYPDKSTVKMLCLYYSRFCVGR